MSTSDMTDTPAVRRPPPGDVATLTAMEGLAALERGALSCEAWTRACLERIEQRNGQVQAWVQVDAHGRWRAPRMGPPRTPALAGRRAAGHQGHDRYRRPADGAGRSRDFSRTPAGCGRAVVSQARALGFNVLGKNTVSRHAIMLPGPARNPHDLTRTPAASSADPPPPWPISWRRCLLARRRPDPSCAHPRSAARSASSPRWTPFPTSAYGATRARWT